MKDGDASLILENVNFNDAGTYECHVRITGRHGLDLFSSIELIVKFSGEFKMQLLPHQLFLFRIFYIMCFVIKYEDTSCQTEPKLKLWSCVN